MTLFGLCHSGLAAVNPFSVELSTVPDSISELQKFSLPLKQSMSSSKYVQGSPKNRAPNAKDSNPLPTNPYIYQVPSTSISVEFSGYGRALEITNALLCIHIAIDEVEEHERAGQMDTPINRSMVHYTSHGVILILYPFLALPRKMTWSLWINALNAILHFLELYDCVRFYFSVMESETQLGNGFLDASA